MYLRIFGNDIYVFEIPWYLPFGDIAYLAIIGDFISFWQIMKYHDFDRYHDFMSCHEITISWYHDFDESWWCHEIMMSCWCHDVEMLMSWFWRWCQFWPFWWFRDFSLFFNIAHFIDFYLLKYPHFAFVRGFRKVLNFGPYFQAGVPRGFWGVLGHLGVIFGDSKNGPFFETPDIWLNT